ncbi:SCO-spondin-like, partial [Osmerus eperlanus]|uniref:SCO-spondin-like n=1 Tax=Osmerus eperlanus TaxID=29151 RepID=UPI002E11A5D4
CQTEPCERCVFQDRSHAVGERWRGGLCQLCVCLPNLTVLCSSYCPHAASGCPQGQRLVPEERHRCCYCADQGGNVTVTTAAPATVTVSSPPVTPTLPTYPLPPADECWSPLGVQSLPDSSFSSSSHQRGHPPWAGRLYGRDPRGDLQGWSPEAEQYRDLPPGPPPAHGLPTQPPYLQLDLLDTHNITGVLLQGGGASEAFVSSLYLQFSPDARHWHTYQELVTEQSPRAK